MERITNPELQDDPRKFVEGSEDSPATPLSIEWLNALQAELMHLIESSGQTPSGNDLTQLLQAIQHHAPGVQVDEFTTSGTWTKPKGAKFVQCILIGQGGGGASGGVDIPTFNVWGGGGGGGGAMQVAFLPATELGDSCAVLVPNDGGQGGEPSLDKYNPGVDGAPVSIRLHNGAHLLAAGGSHAPSEQPGLGGGIDIGIALAGGSGGIGRADVGYDGYNVSNWKYGYGRSGGAGGGGGGGGHPGSLTEGKDGGRGAGGGYSSDMNAGGSNKGGAHPDAPAPASIGYLGGGGGGGAGSVIDKFPGGRGADGAKYGGGGGGGGAAKTGHPSGAGGNGGPGIVVIVSYF